MPARTPATRAKPKHHSKWTHILSSDPKRRRGDCMGGADTGLSNEDEELNLPQELHHHNDNDTILRQPCHPRDTRSTPQHWQTSGTAASTSSYSATPSRPPEPHHCFDVPLSLSSHNVARLDCLQPKLHKVNRMQTMAISPESGVVVPT
jgi:hypothetical protein